MLSGLLRSPRLSSVTLASLVSLALFACQGTTRRGGSDDSPLASPENLSTSEIAVPGARASFRSDHHSGARALLQAAQLKFRAGDHRGARTELYRAQQSNPPGEVGSEIRYWIAQCYLEAKQFRLARRYFEKALADARLGRRSEIFAYLTFCATREGDRVAAARFRGKIGRPTPPGLEAIASGKTTRLARIAAPANAKAAAPRVASSGAASTRRPSARPIRVHGRARWNARRAVPRRLNRMGPISRITVHHSAGPSFWDQSVQGTAQHIRNIQKVHQQKNGWADIGYHFVVDRTGKIWEGRSLRYQGAHAGGSANRGNVGVVVLGNYTRQELNRPQVESLARLVTWLSDRYDVPHHRVHTHRELGDTTCPGPKLDGWVRQIRRGLERRLFALGK